VEEFIRLVKLIVVGILILATIKSLYVSAAWYDRRTAAAAAITSESATPVPGPCVRHYATREAGQRITFVKSCEVR